MKYLITTVAVCFAISVSAAALQEQQPTQKQTPPEVTLTGCLVQGSVPTVFIFENAKKDPKSTTEKGAKYVVVVASEDLNLRTHLNHEVRITGQPDGKPQPTGQVEEKDLPRITAKAVTMVSNTCQAPTR